MSQRAGSQSLGAAVPQDAARARMAGRLLTAEELAERWQVPKQHVYRLSREARLPTVRLGRYCRYRLAAVEAFEQQGGTGADD